MRDFEYYVYISKGGKDTKKLAFATTKLQVNYVWFHFCKSQN